MELRARPAEIDDVATLADLLVQGVAEQAEGRGGPIWSVRETRARPGEESFGDDLRSDVCEIVVGLIDDVVLGYGTVRLEILRDGSRLGVIDELFVHPGAREVGLGETMMSRIMDRCRAWGCRGIDSHALPGNRLTKNFFESFGFTARLLVVHHRLEVAEPETGEDP